MRMFLSSIVVLGLAGCGTQAVNFEHQSELEVDTRGLALDEDGDDGVAGMFGTTCRVTVQDGSIGADYDFPTSDEEVQDGGRLFGEDAVVVVSTFGAHVTYPDRVWDWTTDDYGVPGVIEGRVWDEGLVMLRDDGSCGVDWQSSPGDLPVSTELPADACAGGPSLAITDTGDAYVANGNDVMSVTEDGYEVIDEGADLVEWDDTAEVLYAAMAGSSELRGLEADGAVRWTTTLDGAVIALDSMGPIGAAAVMIARDNGTGMLVTVDGYTGEVTSTLVTPSPSEDVLVSEGGNTLAMVLAREVHFFRTRSLP